jgi:hypothetical protein
MNDSQAYDFCPEAERLFVHALLEAERSEQLHDYPLSRRKDYETRVDLFNLADTIFRCFFPPETEVPTCSKFWGAIEVLVAQEVRVKFSVSHPFF